MYWLFFVFTFFLVESAVSLAQTSPPTSVLLPEVTVLGGLPGKSRFNVVPTVGQLSGPQLNRQRRPSLGETLSTQLGVSSSFFGPNSSRPIIRGMDGDRIRILNNGLGVLDASGASQDHAVSLDPFTIDHVEIVRGSSALLYGGSAVGGVVNVVTNRISETVPQAFEGKLDVQYSSNEQGGLGAVGFNYGVDKWAFHLDGGSKDTKDYQISGYARTREKREKVTLRTDAVEGNGSVPNSSGQTSNIAFGTSYVFNRGSAGVSYSIYNSNYGTVAEQNVRIKMNQDRVDASLQIKNLGWIKLFKFKDSLSSYKHEEIKHDPEKDPRDSVETTFKNQGNEARFEFVHGPVGVWEGLFGLQSNAFDFSATGEESFLPQTKSDNNAIFIREEAKYGRWAPSVGLRLDLNSVKSDSTLVDADPDSLGESRTGGPGITRDFSGGSISLGTTVRIRPAHSLAMSLGYTERAPNYQELFANGPHLATNAFERGDTTLGKEGSQSLELSYRFKRSEMAATVGVFVQDFKGYISLSPKKGGGFDPEGGAGNRELPLYQYESVDAMFYGPEMEIKRSFDNLIPRGVVDLGAKLDAVKAKNTATGDNLPRITPLRETLSAEYKADKFSLDVELQRSEKQSDLAPGEKETDAYEIINLGTEVPLVVSGTLIEVYGRINNLFNQEARNHASFLKDIAPLPGQNIVAGVRASF